MKNTHIQLSHGAGGRQTQSLIQEIFAKAFENPNIDTMNDGAVLDWESDQIVMTTDSFVVDPVFFPGGDIGKLAVCGTVNDLAVMGAKPLYLSVGFILEEGFQIADLERIVKSMRTVADEAGVSIVTGDTKVVQKGKADGVFINTAGVGKRITKDRIGADQVQTGDAILLTGPIGSHGMAVLSARGDLGLEGELISDVAPLNGLIESLLTASVNIHAMRDATRGGVATVLNEIAEASEVEIVVDESSIPVSEAVESACMILGFEPLYIANEGVLVIILPDSLADEAIEIIRMNQYGKSAVKIGEVREGAKGRVQLRTTIGSHRILDMRSGEQLPRIC
ncbi:hydrogenase expression/formation protein HypE [bacterium]